MTATRKTLASKGAGRARATGPTTAAGKAAVARNALTHGATSSRWLTQAECESYDGMLAELKAEYPSTNPLVKMQLERIARLRV